MEQKNIVSLKQFKTLEEFIEAQNNFYLHFCSESIFGSDYRSNRYFIRFKEKYPQLEESAKKATLDAINSVQSKELPYEILFEAYNLMSLLVYVDDPIIIREGRVDEYFLTR